MSFLILLVILHPAFVLSGQSSKLIIIDPLVENEYKNIDSAETGVKVIRLPDDGDPLNYITNELRKSKYDQIHLYMLTKPGSIVFDQLNIIPENIEEHSDDFGQWKGLIKPGTEIIIHSEDLTSEPQGLILTGKIREYTGCVVIVRK